MLKLAGMFFLIIGGAGIGYARSLELTRSQKNLESLLQLLLLLKGEIRCANSPRYDCTVFGGIPASKQRVANVCRSKS